MLRNIIEQSLEFQSPLVINYVDFKKVFNSIHRPSLWKILRIYGVPESYISIFKSLYRYSSCCVKTESGITELFEILSGVQQGCILLADHARFCLEEGDKLGRAGNKMEWREIN